MAYKTYDKLWESEFDNIVSKIDKVEDLSYNQLELEVHDSYKKDEKNCQQFSTLLMTQML